MMVNSHILVCYVLLQSPHLGFCQGLSLSNLCPLASQPASWNPPADTFAGWSQPSSFSLHGLLYVLFLYLDIPLLAIPVHLPFMS